MNKKRRMFRAIAFFSMYVIMLCLFLGSFMLWLRDPLGDKFGSLANGLFGGFFLQVFLIVLVLGKNYWQSKWNKLISENQYDTLARISEKRLRRHKRNRWHQSNYAAALLVSGAIESFMQYAEDLLQKWNEGKEPDKYALKLRLLRNIVFFLKNEEDDIQMISTVQADSLESDSYSVKEQALIESFVDNRYENALELAIQCRTPNRFFTCVTAVVQSKIYNAQKHELQAAFYKQQALETATSEELRQLVAQRLAGIAQDHTG